MISATRTRQRGFSLVEVMAGLLVGLLTTIVIYQVLSVSESYRRTSAGGGEGMQNGAIALYALERDIKQAGAGLEIARFGDTLAVNEGGRNIPNVLLAPVVITPGVANAADTIRVLYGAAVGNGDIKRIAAPGMANVAAPISLTSVFGLNDGDIFIIAEAGLTGVMGHVSSIAGATVNHANVQTNGFNFNGVAFPAIYTPAAVFLNLGQLVQGVREPALNEYTVDADSHLTQTRLLVTNNPVAIADDIFTIKAQYGVDTDGDDVTDTYRNTLPAGVGFAAVRSIRLAILTRINAFEKQAVSPATIKLWPDSAVTPTTTGPVVNLAGNDRNYRYRVFSTVIPLRNVVWPATRVP